MTGINARTLTRVRPQVGTAAVEDWRNQAECKDVADSTFDLWFPERGANAKDARDRHNAYRYARGICADCPVRRDCLADALKTREFGGMRGRLDPDELRAIAHAPEPYYGPACRDKPGTTAGYDRHKKVPEPPCEPCRAASARQRREERARRAERDLAVAS